MLESFYVDDLVSGDDSTQSTYNLYLKAKTRLAKGRLKLRKWKTNDSELRKRIDSEKNSTNQNATAIDSGVASGHAQHD